MTDSKLNETIPETSTVEVNLESQYAKIESSKHKIDFVVSKTRSQTFFSVKVTKGALPNELTGKYSSLEKAVESVQTYIRNSQETFAVKSDRLHEERQQRKHAKS
jgi:leucyl-tRNA synthetase